MNKLTHVLAMLFLFTAQVLPALPLNVDYYGVVSQSSNTNILKMAQDIFLTQLNSIDQIRVNDKRPDAAKTLAAAPAIPDGSHIAFYAEIAEAGADGAPSEWNCTFNAVAAGGKTYGKTETYDSYYKILVGAKSAIEDVLNQIPQENAPQPAAVPSAAAIKPESLAGTWSGEPYTDKIVLLRGGRGFVIFKNGASMNVSVTVQETDARGNVSHVEVRQVGKPNASFYPALPRETALASAADAEPIVWRFTVTADGALSGTKTTLVPSADSATGAAEGTESVQWIKK
ncbi:MAG: hypothetical protein K2I74_09320 [Treponemataceae bacterium]|nr:hypothetical protein [Treponemataceae bacterium]